MRILVLGCGEMGEFAIRDLHGRSPVDEIVVGARDPERARSTLADIVDRGPALTFRPADADDDRSLEAAMSGCDAVVNCIGPNYRYEVPVALAAIRARVHLVDLNDDYEATLAMLELDARARDAGITIVLGLGASPGVTNVLVRAAADQLDEVEEIHTAWVMTASDPGGLALSYHLLHSLSHRALTYQDGRVVEVRSFVDGRQRLSFPEPVGEIDVFHVGHPEPLTLMRSFPEARCIDDKASFAPPEVNDWILALGRIAREAGRPVPVDGIEVDAMDFAASYLRQRCKGLENAPRDGALYVEVAGRRGRKRRRVFFSSAGRLGHGTGIPAAIGAVMLAQGRIEKQGVLASEACLDAHDFLYELFQRRDVAKLNGWVEE